MNSWPKSDSDLLRAATRQNTNRTFQEEPTAGYSDDGFSCDSTPKDSKSVKSLTATATISSRQSAAACVARVPRGYIHEDECKEQTAPGDDIVNNALPPIYKAIQPPHTGITVDHIPSAIITSHPLSRDIGIAPADLGRSALAVPTLPRLNSCHALDLSVTAADPVLDSLPPADGTKVALRHHVASLEPTIDTNVPSAAGIPIGASQQVSGSTSNALCTYQGTFSDYHKIAGSSSIPGARSFSTISDTMKAHPLSHPSTPQWCWSFGEARGIVCVKIDDHRDAANSVFSVIAPTSPSIVPGSNQDVHGSVPGQPLLSAAASTVLAAALSSKRTGFEHDRAMSEDLKNGYEPRISSFCRTEDGGDPSAGKSVRPLSCTFPSVKSLPLSPHPLRGGSHRGHTNFCRQPSYLAHFFNSRHRHQRSVTGGPISGSPEATVAEYHDYPSGRSNLGSGRPPIRHFNQLLAGDVVAERLRNNTANVQCSPCNGAIASIREFGQNAAGGGNSSAAQSLFPSAESLSFSQASVQCGRTCLHHHHESGINSETAVEIKTTAPTTGARSRSKGASRGVSRYARIRAESQTINSPDSSPSRTSEHVTPSIWWLLGPSLALSLHAFIVAIRFALFPANDNVVQLALCGPFMALYLVQIIGSPLRVFGGVEYLIHLMYVDGGLSLGFAVGSWLNWQLRVEAQRATAMIPAATVVSSADNPFVSFSVYFDSIHACWKTPLGCLGLSNSWSIMPILFGIQASCTLIPCWIYVLTRSRVHCRSLVSNLTVGVLGLAMAGVAAATARYPPHMIYAWSNLVVCTVMNYVPRTQPYEFWDSMGLAFFFVFNLAAVGVVKSQQTLVGHLNSDAVLMAVILPVIASIALSWLAARNVIGRCHGACQPMAVTDARARRKAMRNTTRSFICSDTPARTNSPAGRSRRYSLQSFSPLPNSM